MDEQKITGDFERQVRAAIIGEPGTEQKLMLTLAAGLDRANARVETLIAGNRRLADSVVRIVRESTANGSLRR